MFWFHAAVYTLGVDRMLRGSSTGCSHLPAAACREDPDLPDTTKGLLLVDIF